MRNLKTGNWWKSLLLVTIGEGCGISGELFSIYIECSRLNFPLTMICGPKLCRISDILKLPNGCYFYIQYSQIHIVLAYLAVFQTHKPWHEIEVRKY